MARPAREAVRGIGAVVLLAWVACAGWPLGSPGGETPEPEAAAAPVELPPADLRVARPWLVALVAIGGLTGAAWGGGEAGEASPAAPPAMPFLARLAAAGAAAPRLVPVTPASHSPAMASLVTGRTPARHRITSERQLSDAGVEALGFGRAEQLEGPTLWSVAGDADRRVAVLGWPATLGASVALLLPDVGITPRGLPWLATLSDKASPGLLDLARMAGGDAPATVLPGPERDRVLADVACEVVASPAPPNLLLLHLGQARLPVARDGPDAPSVREALGRADADLERLVGCLARSQRLEGAALVVVGDHGSAPVHTALAPNTLLEGAGLLASQPDGRTLQGWRAIARSNGGSAFVYARSADDALRARRALQREADAGGLFRVVAAEELLRLGADPEAWFGLEAMPGYHFVDDLGVAFAAPSALRGSGGYLPERSEMAPGFVAWGRGVRAGVEIPWMRQIDVAPTVAALLGVELPEADGQPVVGLLNVPLTPELARRLPFRDGRRDGDQEDDRWQSSPAGQ